MSNIIKEFAIPLSKHDHSDALDVKQRIFRSTFNTSQRHEYSKYIANYKNERYEKYKLGNFDTLSELSQLIVNEQLNDAYNSFENEYQELWLKNFSKSLSKLDSDSDTINYFIVPLLFNNIDAFNLHIMLTITEQYHDLRTALNTMMLSIEYCKNECNYDKTISYVNRFKEVMTRYHNHNMVELLNPMDSPLMIKNNNGSNTFIEYSGLLCFLKHIEDMLDYSSFIQLIDRYTSERKGIDIDMIRETDDIRKFLITYFNTSTKKQQRNFISCLIKYYDGEDKEYVIRKNKRWLKKLINELDQNVQHDLYNTLKLLNLTI